MANAMKPEMRIGRAMERIASLEIALSASLAIIKSEAAKFNVVYDKQSGIAKRMERMEKILKDRL